MSSIGGVGRKKINEEQMPARFKGGTVARIDAVRHEKENRAEFIRVAVENELERRERVRPTPRRSTDRKK